MSEKVSFFSHSATQMRKGIFTIFFLELFAVGGTGPALSPDVTKPICQ